jgi:hypothetical protein
VDERVHYNFYKQAVLEWMKHDDRGTAEDIKYVFDNFLDAGAQPDSRAMTAPACWPKPASTPARVHQIGKEPDSRRHRLDKDYQRHGRACARIRRPPRGMLEEMKREQIDGAQRQQRDSQK